MTQPPNIPPPVENQPERWLARAICAEFVCAVVVLLLLASAICAHGQRGTLAWLKPSNGDRLTWDMGTNRFPVYTEVQSRAGSIVWVHRTNTTANSVWLPRDTRSATYRIRHVFYFNGLGSDWITNRIN
jgi:hypothetical protein